MYQTETLIENRIDQGSTDFEQWMHQWGNSISEAILDFPCKFFRIPEIDGFIGYIVSNHCAVVFGDPICAPENKKELAIAFQKYCTDNSLSYIYFIASEEFAKWAIDHVCKIMVHVGEEMIFDPFIDATLGHKGYKLRNRINHAKNLGLIVKEYVGHDESVEKGILNVGKIWQEARKGPQIYLGSLNFFERRNDRRWFYLEDSEKNIIGMALLSRLNAHAGWLLKFLITVPDVPRGSSELLMLSILETLRNEDCHYITYGIIPAEALEEMVGLGSVTSWMVKSFFKLVKWTFNLDQRKLYWQKFYPHTEKSYLLFSRPFIGLNEIKAISSALKTDF